MSYHEMNHTLYENGTARRLVFKWMMPKSNRIPILKNENDASL